MTGDQFKAFIREHLARHRRSDWPAGDDAISFFGCWLSAFKTRHVTPDEADDASRWLLERGGAFPDNHLGYLLGRVECRRRDREVEAAAARRAEARAAVGSEVERERRLRAAWDRLGEAERNRIVAEVEAENPGLVEFPVFVTRLALERAAAELAR